MKKVYKVKNVKCQSCANIITSNFKDEFSDLSVDVENQKVSLSIKDEEREKSFKKEMSELGFDVE